MNPGTAGPWESRLPGYRVSLNWLTGRGGVGRWMPLMASRRRRARSDWGEQAADHRQPSRHPRWGLGGRSEPRANQFSETH